MANETASFTSLLPPVFATALSSIPNLSGKEIDAYLGTWYRTVDYLSANLGEAAAGILAFYVVFKVWNLFHAVTFDLAEYSGLLKAYCIQPDKVMPWEMRWASYKRRHGWNSWKGAVKVLLPSYAINYFAMNLFYGAKTTDRFTWSAGETLYKLALAFFIHDAVLWFIHWSLHQVPWAYKTIHKTHHEIKNPRISISGDLTITDYYLMDRGPPTLVAVLLKMPFPVYMLYQLIFYYTANRAHCGHSIRIDPCNWLWPRFVEYHDFHHSYTHNAYQTWGWWWDSLVGGNTAFYKHVAEKEAAKKAKKSS